MVLLTYLRTESCNNLSNQFVILVLFIQRISNFNYVLFYYSNIKKHVIQSHIYSLFLFILSETNNPYYFICKLNITGQICISRHNLQHSNKFYT